MSGVLLLLAAGIDNNNGMFACSHVAELLTGLFFNDERVLIVFLYLYQVIMIGL